MARFSSDFLGLGRSGERFLASLDVATSQRILEACEEDPTAASGISMTWKELRIPLELELE